MSQEVVCDREASNAIYFWAPYTVDYTAATTSVYIKAPEEGNKERRIRNQSIVRTRAGNVIVYDRGTDHNTKITLEFKDVPDADRAQLIVFLEAIQWASTRVCYKDMYGTVYIVRIAQDNGLEYSDMGLNTKRGLSYIRWNFNLDLINLTDNPAELETVDTVPTSALALHIANTDQPHDPEVSVLVDIADATITLESFTTLAWRSVEWTVFAKKGTASAVYRVTCTHDRLNSATIATAATQIKTTLVEQGTVTSIVTLTSDVNGAGVAQTMRLRCAVSTDGWTVCIRRTKIGSELGLLVT